jgi:hypothetical protein
MPAILGVGVEWNFCTPIKSFKLLVHFKGKEIITNVRVKEINTAKNIMSII